MKLIYNAVGMCGLLSQHFLSSLCSSESIPDLLTAVKILAGSTVEIAAASVGETSLVKAVQKVEEDGKGLDFTLEVVEPEILEATTEEVTEDTAVVMNKEQLKSDTDAEDAKAPAAEEEIFVLAAAEEEEEEKEKEEERAAATLPEEPTASALTVEEVGEAEVEDQTPVPGVAPEESISSAVASPEDSAPAEETTASEEDTIIAEATLAAETSVEEAAAADASAEETAEAAAVVDSIQLAAASSGSELELLSTAEPESTSEVPVHEGKHCHSSVSSTAEEVAPPVDLGGQLENEGAVDMTHEAKEALSLVQGQKPKMSVWTVKSCSVM
uniref:brain acid soluble protein 1-like n=1 Tax=Scatophagus argus TaxID=75038 RepID=UPI001ED8358A|nr:brain acid soluble protein 1-like [Scatophagus argus]